MSSRWINGIICVGSLSQANLLTNPLGQSPKVHQFSWLWKSGCPGKHRFFFFWKLLFDRLNIRNMLNRKNMYLPSYYCVLCNADVEETVDHIFFGCFLSSWCWRLLGTNWNHVVPILDRLSLGWLGFSVPSIFMEIIIVAAWVYLDKVK